MKTKSSLIQSQKKGFTMMEVIVAIFILEVVAVSGYTLISRVAVGASSNQNKLAASYLVQEKFELIRNIRDTNWLQGEYWTDTIFDEIETIDNFTRTTTIGGDNDMIEIEVIVSWRDLIKTYNVTAVNYLYNWYEN